MLAILAVLLLLVMIAPMVLGRDRRLFYSLNLYCFLNAIMIIPGVLVVSYNPDLLIPDIYFAVRPTARTIAWTMAMIGLLSVTTYLAYYMVMRRRLERSGGLLPAPALRLHAYESNYAIIALMAIALAVFVQKLSLFGGLAGLTGNVSNRVALQAGLGPVNFLASVSVLLATIFAVRRALTFRTMTAYGVLIGVALASMIMSSLFGGRKDSLQLAVMILVIISIYNARFLRLNPRTLVFVAGAYLAAMFYFISILVYRSGLGDASVGGFVAELSESFDSYQEFLLSLSYFDTYYFVTNFFDSSNFYHGATFLDLYTTFVPSGLMPDKPPVDDGMFVRAATLGYLLQPGTPAYFINHNSFPPETLGAAYMNGGAFLVGVFGLLLGWVLGQGQKLIERFPNSPAVILIYLNIFLNFEISNLRITQLIVQGGFALLLVAMFRTIANIVARPQPAARPTLPA